MNPVVRENAREGAQHWWGEHAPPRAIEGYSSECSVRPGDRLELHVSTAPAERYRIVVYRLGWYRGQGARTVTVHPPTGDLQGVARSAPELCPGPQIDSAGWPVTDVVPIGK